jgi:hypothetical protein
MRCIEDGGMDWVDAEEQVGTDKLNYGVLIERLRELLPCAISSCVF